MSNEAVAFESLPEEETPVLDESLCKQMMVVSEGTGSTVADIIEASSSVDQEQLSSINRSAAAILSQFSD